MTTQWIGAAGAVALVGPWAAVVVTSPGDPAPNLVAIPTKVGSLDAGVAPVFATAPYFVWSTSRRRRSP